MNTTSITLPLPNVDEYLSNIINNSPNRSIDPCIHAIHEYTASVDQKAMLMRKYSGEGIIYSADSYKIARRYDECIPLVISWDLIISGRPCTHCPEKTGMRCNCRDFNHRLFTDIVSQPSLPTKQEHIIAVEKIFPKWTVANIHRFIASDKADLLFGVIPLINMCVGMNKKDVVGFVRNNRDRIVDDSDRLTAAVILGETKEVYDMLVNSLLPLNMNVFGSFGFSRGDAYYRALMIKIGLSHGHVLTGKAKIFVRKTSKLFDRNDIRVLFGDRSHINGYN